MAHAIYKGSKRIRTLTYNKLTPVFPVLTIQYFQTFYEHFASKLYTSTGICLKTNSTQKSENKTK